MNLSLEEQLRYNKALLMIDEIFKLAFKALKTNFLPLFLIQLPVGLLVFLQNFLEPLFESNPIIALIILLPLFSFVSSLCTALTYIAVQSLQTAPKLKFTILKQLSPETLTKLTATSLLVAIFLGLGLAALVIPGIYFTAIYLFVPVLVVLNPSQKASQYLFESKKLVTQNKKILFSTLSIASLSFMIDFPLSQVVRLIGGNASASLLIDSFLTMISGAFFDCFVIFYFQTLKRKESA